MSVCVGRVSGGGQRGEQGQSRMRVKHHDCLVEEKLPLSLLVLDRRLCSLLLDGSRWRDCEMAGWGHLQSWWLCEWGRSDKCPEGRETTMISSAAFTVRCRVLQEMVQVSYVTVLQLVSFSGQKCGLDIPGQVLRDAYAQEPIRLVENAEWALSKIPPRSPLSCWLLSLHHVARRLLPCSCRLSHHRRLMSHCRWWDPPQSCPRQTWWRLELEDVQWFQKMSDEDVSLHLVNEDELILIMFSPHRRWETGGDVCGRISN